MRSRSLFRMCAVTLSMSACAFTFNSNCSAQSESGNGYGCSAHFGDVEVAGAPLGSPGNSVASAWGNQPVASGCADCGNPGCSDCGQQGCSDCGQSSAADCGCNARSFGEGLPCGMRGLKLPQMARGLRSAGGRDAGCNGGCDACSSGRSRLFLANPIPRGPATGISMYSRGSACESQCSGCESCSRGVGRGLFAGQLTDRVASMGSRFNGGCTTCGSDVCEDDACGGGFNSGLGSGLGGGLLAGRAASIGSGLKYRVAGLGSRLGSGCDTCGAEVETCGCEEVVEEAGSIGSGGLFGKIFNRGRVGCEQGDCGPASGGLGQTLKRGGMDVGARLRGIGTSQAVEGCDTCGSDDSSCGCGDVSTGIGGGLLGNRFSGRGLVGRNPGGAGLGLHSGLANGGLANGGLANGGLGYGARGCGRGGCGMGGNGLCNSCHASLGLRGQIPHTTPPPQGMNGPGGQAPSYAYPYYTTRAPRDFLMDNPPSIGW